MAWGLSAALLTLLCAEPARGDAASRALRDDAARSVRDRFERVGRAPPQEDSALSEAAAALAASALLVGPARASAADRVGAAVAAHGGYDFEPRAVLLRAPRGGGRAALAESDALAVEAASAVGVGVAADESHEAVAVLLAERRLELLEAPPRRALVGASSRLCALLAPGLERPALFVADPLGVVRRVPVATGAAGERCAVVRARAQGRHTLQLVAEDARGPRVLALFELFAEATEARRGHVPAAAAAPLDPDVALAEGHASPSSEGVAAALARLQALRAHHGLPRLEPDARLDAVARDYAALLARAGLLTHVGPDGSTLADRLATQGLRHAVVSESLARASHPLAAQANLERSPAHRSNLLAPGATRVGLGLARTASGAVVLVELLASTLPPSGGQTPTLGAVGTPLRGSIGPGPEVASGSRR